MKKWQVTVLPVASVMASFAVYMLLKNKKVNNASGKNNTDEIQNKANKNFATGMYSFVVGYGETATEEVCVKYDSEKFTFSVVEDDFLCYSSDSHVAVMYGEDFNIQIEYADFASGDDFAKLKAYLNDKYRDVEECAFGEKPSYRYTDGDGLCICMEAGPGYVLITVLPAKDSKETAITLKDNSELKEILNLIKIERK